MSTSRLGLGLLLGLAACAPDVAGAAHSPGLPPFLAWLEPRADVVTVVVMPLRALGGSVQLEVDGHPRRTVLIGSAGVREAFSFDGTKSLGVEATWQDPSGAAGARALLRYPDAQVTPPRFVPIVRHEAGRSGLVVDEAVRIR